MQITGADLFDSVLVLSVLLAGQAAWIWANWRTPGWSWLQAIWPLAAMAAYVAFAYPIYARKFF